MLKYLRRSPIFSVAGILWLIPLLGFGQSVQEVAYVSITVSDLERSVRYFEDILSFKQVETFEEKGKELNDLFGMDYEGLKIKKARLTLGGESIELLQYMQPVTGRSVPWDSKSNDLWFQHIAIVVNDMEAAYKVLSNHKVKHVSTAPQTLPDYIQAAAGIKAFYFRDPDEHNLEIISFPPGKGDPKWQNIPEGPFLGIDHTAIGISDTDQGLLFYRDLLGFSVPGNSENYGPEQEHLNQVFGARLLITGLKAKAGFGVEFLNYIAPPGGRKYPENSRPNDLWHWHTVLKVDHAEGMFTKLSQTGQTIVSHKVVDLSRYNFGGDKGFMARDPDGHALLFIE